MSRNGYFCHIPVVVSVLSKYRELLVTEALHIQQRRKVWKIVPHLKQSTVVWIKHKSRPTFVIFRFSQKSTERIAQA